MIIFYMRRPLRTDEEYNEYVKDFYRKIEEYDWNKITDNFCGLESFLHRARERMMCKLVARYGRGNRFLDVGCGTGLILRHLPPGAVGIDLNPRHIERARKYVPQAVVEIGDAEHLKFADSQFSTVICTEVFEHLVHPEDTLKEIYRVLQPGGVLIGSTPRHALFWRFRFLSSTHYHNEPFHNEFNRQEIMALLHRFRYCFLGTGFFRAQWYFVVEKS